MPQFAVNANRFDPYKNFKFRVKWDGKFVAGVSRVTGLRVAVSPPAGLGGALGALGPLGSVAAALPAVSGAGASSPSPSSSSGPDAGTVIAAILFGMPWLLAPRAVGTDPGSPAATVTVAGNAVGGAAQVPVAPVNVPATWVPLRLERGITHDAAFYGWFDAVLAGDAAHRTKDLVIELCNEAGQPVIAWQVLGCVPIEYVAVPVLDSNAPAVAIESLTLAYKSFHRDPTVVEPNEPFLDR